MSAASTLVVAVVVGALALVEAALSPPASKLARGFPDPALARDAGALPDQPNASARPDAVLFVND